MMHEQPKTSTNSLAALMAAAVYGARNSLQAIGGGRRKRKRKKRSLTHHPDAPPAPFRGKINFRRSDFRHQAHPSHQRYMEVMRRLQRKGAGFNGTAQENHWLVLSVMFDRPNLPQGGRP